MKLQQLFLCAFSLFAADVATAQSVRQISVAPDGAAMALPLTAEDMGRDIVLLAETTEKSAQKITITLGGPPGVSGRVSTQLVPADTVIESLDLASGWTPISVRYPGGDLKPYILVGESTTGSSGTSGCPSWMTQEVIQGFVQLYRTLPQYGPGITEAQVCALLSGGLNFGSNQNNGEEETSTGLTPASGVALRDACSAKYKLVVQYRINTAGQPASSFNGTQSLQASLKVKKTKVINAGTLKAAEGRDGHGSYIYLAPAIRYTWNQNYGAPGSDKLLVQKYRKDGSVQWTKTFKTRPLFGKVVYDISNVTSVLKGKGKLTFTTQNGSDAYSRCVPAVKKRWFFGKYQKLHGISG